MRPPLMDQPCNSSPQFKVPDEAAKPAMPEERKRPHQPSMLAPVFYRAQENDTLPSAEDRPLLDRYDWQHSVHVCYCEARDNSVF